MMNHKKQKTAPFRVTFIVNLPTCSADFHYSLCSEQAAEESIILMHFPLEAFDRNSLRSVFNLCTIK